MHNYQHKSIQKDNAIWVSNELQYMKHFNKTNGSGSKIDKIMGKDSHM